MYEMYDDPASAYGPEDYVENKMEGFVDGDEDIDEMNVYPVGRKESRIPVAIRRLRSRGDRDKINQDDGNPEWQDREVTVIKRDDRRARRQHKSALTATTPSKTGLVVVKSVEGVTMDKRKVGPHVCPDCNRTFAVVNREGVYVAFSIGIMPLLMLLVFVVVLAVAPYCAPVIVRKMKKLPPIQERANKVKKGAVSSSSGGGVWSYFSWGNNKKK